MSVLDAVRGRRSWSKVTDAAPARAELLPLIAAAGRVADHSSLRPWRLIELRGADREVLGRALHEAAGEDGVSSKPLRAPLLLAVVASYRPSGKVPRWEQEAVASGVAHTLSLLLDEAGWGVIWRTGPATRSAPVARAHGLGPDEELLGWLYVGGKPESGKEGPRRTVDPEEHLTPMPHSAASARVRSPADARRAEKARKAERKAAKRAAKASPTPEDEADPIRRAARKAAEKAGKAARRAEKAAERARRAQARVDALDAAD